MHSPPGLLVIGGGAAGIIAAWRAATLGAAVLLLEKNPRLGVKILISGGGKCNVTHAGDMEEMRRAFRPNEGVFLRPAFRAFTNADLRKLLGARGVETYERENGKVFPVHHKAGEVVHALRRMLEESGVAIRLDAAVRSVTAGEETFAVTLASETIHPSAVVIACGGMSYAKTGTTGDGYPWLRSFGLSIVPPRPALAPILIDPKPPAAWAGVAIRDCVFSARVEERIVTSWRGDLLFTHTGLSGPCALEVSRGAFESLEKEATVSLEVDCIPGSACEALDATLRDNLRDHGAKELRSIAAMLIPARLVPALLDQAGLDGGRRGHQIGREERKTLARTLKHWIVGRVRSIEIDRGEVTAGGLALDEVDARTMMAKKVPGLFVCGEILDIAGPVGGYNLQAAFSTGYLAGEGAAKYLAAR